MSFTHPDDILTLELLVENSSNCKMYKDLSNVGLGKALQAGDKAITEFVAYQSRIMNYAVELVCPWTGKVLKRILKIQGLTMSSKNVTNQMNLGVMLDMVRSLQDGKLARKWLSQFRLKVKA